MAGRWCGSGEQGPGAQVERGPGWLLCHNHGEDGDG